MKRAEGWYKTLPFMHKSVNNRVPLITVRWLPTLCILTYSDALQSVPQGTLEMVIIVIQSSSVILLVEIATLKIMQMIVPPVLQL